MLLKIYEFDGETFRYRKKKLNSDCIDFFQVVRPYEMPDRYIIEAFTGRGEYFVSCIYSDYFTAERQRARLQRRLMGIEDPPDKNRKKWRRKR